MSRRRVGLYSRVGECEPQPYRLLNLAHPLLALMSDCNVYNWRPIRRTNELKPLVTNIRRLGVEVLRNTVVYYI